MPEILEVSQMIAPAYEPKRQNRWVLEWDGIDAYTVRSFSRPNLSFDEITVDYINTKRYFQGKFSWQTVDLVLNDPIAPSQAQKVMEWVRLGFENITGRAGFKEFYTAKNFKLKLLDPAGSVVELWDFINPMLMSANFNSLDYGQAEIAQVNISIRFDMVILMY